MSENQPETAHDGDGGPSGAPTPGMPIEPENEPAADDANSGDAESRSIPVGSPVDEETYAELKRRAEQPDEDAPPAQDDPS
ncbi:hypothetical protein [Kribbella sp. NPDC049227]|jgi:hypothetical protein|uniref:hypothetical protein n=1 Tax=Kribbella sp. NPDC049227 TaxID=3364113 RepID=UPI00371F413A